MDNLDLRQLELDLFAVMAKHDLPHAVIAFRDDTDLRVRVFADTNSPMDVAASKAMASIVEMAIRDGQATIIEMAIRDGQATIIQAMKSTTRRN